MGDFSQLYDALADLEKNPLFHSSLGSKELFHSNVIAWMCNTFPVQMREVFHGFLQPGDCQRLAIERERLSLDLILELPGCAPLVVENKVKSLPDLTQLSRYETLIKKRLGAATRLLLCPSATAPSYERLGGWSHLSYAQLADRLRIQLPSLEGEGADPFHVRFVEEYASLARGVESILDAATIKSLSEDYFRLDDYALLRRHRVHDVFYKHRALCLVRLLNERLKTALGDSGLSHDVLADAAPSGDLLKLKFGTRALTASSGFTRGLPIVNVFYRPATRPFIVGVQLQGNSFRISMIFPVKGANKADRLNERLDLAKAHALEWIDFSVLDAAYPEARAVVSGPLRKEFGGFDPDFVHRYKPLVRWPDVMPAPNKDEEVLENRLPKEMSVERLLTLFECHAREMIRRDRFAAQCPHT